MDCQNPVKTSSDALTEGFISLTRSDIVDEGLDKYGIGAFANYEV